MPQIISNPKGSTVDWNFAELFAKIVGNQKPIWTCFPPQGGSCYHFPTSDEGVIPREKVESCLSKNPKHSLGIIVNPHRPKPEGFSERTWGARNEDIESSQVLFCEGDGGLELIEQYRVVRSAVLVPPSFSIFSGGKSLHHYWLLGECISPEKFRELQKKIRDLLRAESSEFGADKSIHSPAQVMRVVGGQHPSSGLRTTFWQVFDSWGDQLTPSERAASGETYKAKSLIKYSVKFLEDMLAHAATYQKKPIEENQKNINFDKKRFISKEALEKEGGWFTRLEPQWHEPLAIEMLSDFVVKRNEINLGERNDCFKVLCGLLNFFGEEKTAEIVIKSKWESPNWNPIKEIKSINPPYTNSIGNLVYEAKFGKGKRWIYENSPVIKESKSIVFIEDVFPAEISKNLRILNKYLNYPDHLVISSFLCAVAASLKLQTRLELNAATDYEVVTNLFTATVGLSGSMKTALVNTFVKKPLALVEQEIKSQYLENLKQYIKDQKENKEDDDIKEPNPTQVIINDATEESLQKLLESCDKEKQSVLVLKDELSSLFVFDRYHKGTERQFYLLLWDGEGFNVARLQKGKNVFRQADSTQVSVCGNIQDELLAKLMKNSSGDPDGLFARFMFLPNDPRVIKLPSPTEQEKIENRQAREYLQRFLLRVRRLMPFTYQLSNEGLAKFNKYHEEQQVKALGCKRAAAQAIYRKSPAKVAKLSGIINIVRSIDNLEEFIPGEVIEGAIKLVNFSDKFTINFEKKISQSDDEVLMRKLLKITGKSKSPMAWRDIQQRLSQDDRARWDRDTCTKALEKLAHMGMGEIRMSDKGAIYFKKLKDWT